MLEEEIRLLREETKRNRLATEANTEVMEELIVLINQGLDDGSEESPEN